MRAAFAAHPRLRDAGWAAVLLLPLLPDAAFSAGPHTGPLVLVTAAPLWWHRRAPLAALLVTCLLAAPVWGMLGAARPAFPAVLVLAGVVSLAQRRRGAQLRVGVAAAVVVVLVLALTDRLARGGGEPPTSVWASPLVTGPMLAAAVFLGTTLRARREQLRLLRERAEQLQAERDHRAQIAVAAERARIAHELHDVVAHALTVVVRLGDGMAARAHRDPAAPPDAAVLDAMTATSRQALAEMRRLLGVLAEPSGPGESPDRAPLPGGEEDDDGLDAVVAAVRAAGVPVRLTRSGPQEGWSRATRLAVHRIVTGALTNVLDHAGLGARAEVLVSCDGTSVEVIVDDDGVGVGVLPAERSDGRADGRADVRSLGRGRGLLGMRERAEAFGGTFSAGPQPAGGWRVRVVVPVHPADPGATAGQAGPL
ncbi:Signal transduction histidine kinase [Quadrisphaera granulorum]|uniref:histidine kinase n=1 Tax=Quadrisphaera granulorum TaxID=317664 RepID=A0A315ZQ36_9ACTN|nr:histidine kinase [Quadrisphaera granulorum]PWJ47213.1 signal transduction histidine kinase [Quadrisphaera granulorum]SZE98899.1 Signal transduction histidine kinase [Quadrisphaera granulorum]